MNSPLHSAVAPVDTKGTVPTRLMALDVLRGIAVLLVLGNHLPFPPENYPHWISQFLVTWKLGGWIGVDLFFVLSGFLVSGLLMLKWKKTGELTIRRFLYRRGLKIYPSFYVMLLSTTAALLILKRDVPIKNFLGEFLFMQSYAPHMWNHTWSLAVEEHFYIGLAMLCGWFAARRGDVNPFRPLAILGLVVLIVCLTVRSVMSLYLPYSHKSFLMPTHLRIDALFFGVLLAYLYHFHADRLVGFIRRGRWLLLGIAILTSLPAFVWVRGQGWYLHTLGFSVLYLGFGGLLMACTTWPSVTSSGRRLGAPLALIGVHSYSIYLWHMPVLEATSLLVRRIFNTSNYSLIVAIYLLASIIVGIVLYKLIELPVLAWRDRVVPSNS